MSVLLQAVALLQGREDIPSDTCGSTWVELEHYSAMVKYELMPIVVDQPAMLLSLLYIEYACSHKTHNRF